MSVLRQWIIDLTAAAVLSACAMALTPEGRTKRAVRTVCGVVTMMALLSPVTEIADTRLGGSLENYKAEAMTVSGGLSDLNEKLERDIIERETESYISDKGKTMGIEIDAVKVTAMKRDDGFYHPYSAEITAVSDEMAAELNEVIRRELGIEDDRVVWRYTNEE